MYKLKLQALVLEQKTGCASNSSTHLHIYHIQQIPVPILHFLDFNVCVGMALILFSSKSKEMYQFLKKKKKGYPENLSRVCITMNVKRQKLSKILYRIRWFKHLFEISSYKIGIDIPSKIRPYVDFPILTNFNVLSFVHF